MLTFKYVILSFTLLAGLVASAPIADLSDEVELFVRTPPNGAGPAKGMAQAVNIARQIKSSVKPEKDKAVFWSGTKQDASGKTVSVNKDAQTFAKSNGKETLNMALQKNNIKIPTQQQNPQSNRVWDMASKTFATRASGKTDAVLGGAVRKDSVWNRVEKPALMKNDKVTQVTEHNKQSGSSKVTK